jgi:hypothetical protein
MELIKTVKIIGSLILVIIITAIPVLCGLSFGFNWNFYLKLIFTALTICFVAIGTVCVYMESED